MDNTESNAMEQINNVVKVHKNESIEISMPENGNSDITNAQKSSANEDGVKTNEQITAKVVGEALSSEVVENGNINGNEDSLTANNESKERDEVEVMEKEELKSSNCDTTEVDDNINEENVNPHASMKENDIKSSLEPLGAHPEQQNQTEEDLSPQTQTSSIFESRSSPCNVEQTGLVEELITDKPSDEQISFEYSNNEGNEKQDLPERNNKDTADTEITLVRLASPQDFDQSEQILQTTTTSELEGIHCKQEEKHDTDNQNVEEIETKICTENKMEEGNPQELVQSDDTDEPTECTQDTKEIVEEATLSDNASKENEPDSNIQEDTMDALDSEENICDKPKDINNQYQQYSMNEPILEQDSISDQNQYDISSKVVTEADNDVQNIAQSELDIQKADVMVEVKENQLSKNVEKTSDECLTGDIIREKEETTDTTQTPIKMEVAKEVNENVKQDITEISDQNIVEETIIETSVQQSKESFPFKEPEIDIKEAQLINSLESPLVPVAGDTTVQTPLSSTKDEREITPQTVEKVEVELEKEDVPLVFVEGSSFLSETSPQALDDSNNHHDLHMIENNKEERPNEIVEALEVKTCCEEKSSELYGSDSIKDENLVKEENVARDQVNDTKPEIETKDASGTTTERLIGIEVLGAVENSVQMPTGEQTIVIAVNNTTINESTKIECDDSEDKDKQVNEQMELKEDAIIYNDTKNNVEVEESNKKHEVKIEHSRDESMQSNVEKEVIESENSKIERITKRDQQIVRETKKQTTVTETVEELTEAELFERFPELMGSIPSEASQTNKSEVVEGGEGTFQSPQTVTSNQEETKVTTSPSADESGATMISISTSSISKKQTTKASSTSSSKPQGFNEEQSKGEQDFEPSKQGSLNSRPTPPARKRNHSTSDKKSSEIETTGKSDDETTPNCRDVPIKLEEDIKASESIVMEVTSKPEPAEEEKPTEAVQHPVPPPRATNGQTSSRGICCNIL